MLLWIFRCLSFFMQHFNFLRILHTIFICTYFSLAFNAVYTLLLFYTFTDDYFVICLLPEVLRILLISVVFLVLCSLREKARYFFWINWFKYLLLLYNLYIIISFIYLNCKILLQILINLCILVACWWIVWSQSVYWQAERRA